MMIGILAGMGPMSTAPFLDLLMKEWQTFFKAKYDIDYPHILIYSLPTPFYVDRPIDHNTMESVIRDGLISLQNWGARFIAMPCNTAHIYFKSLQNILDIKLLNMIKETVDRIPSSVTKVTVLATKPTIDSKLYQNEILNHNNKFIFNDKWQLLVDSLILSVKTSVNIEEVNDLLHTLLQDIFQNGIEAIIIGCTDLTPLFERVISSFDNLVFVDSSKALISSILNEY